MKILSNNDLDADILDWPVYMGQALELARNVIGTSPNPRVGCVLVKGSDIVGQGWHVAAGQDHAEVMALKEAGKAAESAIAFVSLEPCSHTGCTGPCAEALIKAKVAQVVIASIDPNPAVSGEGVAKLEAAGINVFHLVEFDQAARDINPGYFKLREQGLPYVRCKMAMSLDGRTALANGESQWITGPSARSDVQKLRAMSSAVVTGIETVLADDPSLNVRLDELGFSELEMARNELTLTEQPLRVILDSKLRTPTDAKILASPGLVKIFTTAETTEDKNLATNVEIIVADKSGQRVNLRSMLESLGSDFACTDILVEAGATLGGAFIQSGLVDELILYIAPKLLGSDAKALLDISGLQSMSESINFDIVDIRKVGNDIRVTAKPLTTSENH
ncbi:MAG: riboflavin biosynthesis protein RibD [SAR86 cluster bacterium]|uniref:Riboflavin biosynthesis protein RibD n=1 Tax=SAR86 cluster bacterium TaxID=2030880 RepID=A0A2A5B5J9_9GAMM|nr:MAG: riboflavin biosynthesis protein RibD [SAR86 cluster bacterium]